MYHLGSVNFCVSSFTSCNTNVQGNDSCLKQQVLRRGGGLYYFIARLSLSI